MATYELKIHGAIGGHELKLNNLFTHARDYLVSLFVLSEEQRAYRATLHELEQLSDRDLADIGISRGDLDRVAREAVGKKRVDA